MLSIDFHEIMQIIIHFVGHVDPGEDVFTTAQRETLEESGLKPDQYKVHEQFKEILRYPVKGKPKAVHYWLAELIDKDTAVTLSDEHVQYRWCNLEEAKLLSAKDDMNSCLDKADKFILNI